MVKNFTLLLLLIGFSLTAIAQNPFSGDKSSYVYTYSLTDNDDWDNGQYLLTIEVANDDDSGLKLNWTTDKALKGTEEGSISVSGDLMESSQKVMDNPKSKLSGATAFWLSEIVYKHMINQTDIAIDLGNGESTFSYVNNSQFNFDFNEVEYSANVIVFESQTEAETIEVYGDYDYGNPVILSLSTDDWILELESIETK